jgi:hypothetical protein
MKQLAPDARLLLQVPVRAKSPALAPMTGMLVMLTAEPPLLLIVILSGRLLVAIGRLPKFRLVGES